MRNIYLLAGLLIAAATPATAEEVSQRIAAISLSRSDVVDGLASSRLQARIGRAVDTVCGGPADSLEQFADIARCRKSARAAIAERLAKKSQQTMVAARK
jgi:UrcA family protein